MFIFILHHIILYYQSLFLSSLQFRLKHFYSRSPIFEEGPFENMLYKLTTLHQISSRHKHQEKCKRHEIPQKDVKLEHLLRPLKYHLTRFTELKFIELVKSLIPHQSLPLQVL
jgi:hypothetical protein